MIENHIIEGMGLYKHFGREKVIRGIDIQVDAGEILGILGPSGAGKTTLIKCLIGLLELSEGRVTIGSMPIPNLKIMDSIGYMAQQDALYEDLTGIQNLVFYARLKGMKKNAAEKEAADLLGLIGLSEHINKKVVNYSGGMKKRLSLATALICDPDIIVLDEPAVGIDPLLRELFWTEFNRLKDKGRTIIITTHVMDEADKCSRLILLRDGAVIANGTPDELKKITKRGSIEELFINSAREDLS